MKQKLEDLVKMHLNWMKDHVLTPLCENEFVSVYRCAKPGHSPHMFKVSFTPCGIAIQGDATPERNGTTSARGYSLEWFVQMLDADYLAEKFLTKKYDSDRADEYLNQLKKEHPDKDFEWVETDDPTIFVQLLRDAGIDDCEIPVYGYLPNELAVLVAIQRKFKELYLAQKEESVKL